MSAVVEQYFRDHYATLVKRMTRPAGTVWDAEDVVQTAFERALRWYNPENPPREFPKWFTIILRNALFAKLNEDRGVFFEELDEFDWEAISYEKKQQLQEFVEDMISKEKEDNRPILELFFLQGYSAKEIFEFNSASYPNTRKIIERFRRKVKEALAD